MLSFHELTKSLPPLRDDEPSSLRQEIADEIADHLQCSLRRELLLNAGDEQSARRRVLEKFGDPRQMARQLWFQAMRNKMMSQRLLVGLAAFSMVVSTLLVGMVVWMIDKHSRDNAILLDRVASLLVRPAEARPQRDLNWNHLKIKVALNSEDGAPAVGYSIDVEQIPRIGEPSQQTGTIRERHHAVIGDSGIEDCGFVTSGNYSVTVVTPWGESSNFSFTVSPGQDHQQVCVAPAGLPELVKVSLDLTDLPQEELNSQTAFICSMCPAGTRAVAGRRWAPHFAGWTNLQRPSWVDLPKIMYLPGHGCWMTSNQLPNAYYDSGWSAREAAWKPCRLPLEIELPDHEYYVYFNLIQLDVMTTPQDKTWATHVQVNLPGNNGNSKMLPHFLTKKDDLAVWKIAVPAEVLQCVRENKILPLNSNSSPNNFVGGGMGGGFF